MSKSSGRLHYLDWMRGVAVVLMIQTHAFDSFLAVNHRQSFWYWLSQFLGGMPAPMFLFLAGLSLALTLDRAKDDRIGKVLRRGGWILFLAFAFRFEQAAIWFPHPNWEGFWKVDILNCIGLSTLAVGLSAVALRDRRKAIVGMALGAAAIVLATPLVFMVRTGYPSLLLDYINGGELHGYYFMLFSWSGFAFAGAAIGYALIEARARGVESRFLTMCGAGGVVAFWVGDYINRFPQLRYGFVDYSRTSPQYFLVRLGYMLMFLFVSHLWMRRPTAGRWSPTIVFGQTSLLVYWVHIEVVYGRLRPFTNSLGVGTTALQLVWIVPLMLAISTARVRRLANR